VRGRVGRAGRVVPGLLRELDAAGVTLDSIEVARPTLDDVFLTLTGRSLRDAEAGSEKDDDKEQVPA
jgi:ABC-2 type transport system ATP-binding protein